MTDKDPMLKVALCMSYLTYCGVNIEEGAGTDVRLLKLMSDAIPQIPVLNSGSGLPEWEIVWGPVSHTLDPTYARNEKILSFLEPLHWIHQKNKQDNAAVILKKKGEAEYAVAIRGTNAASIRDWFEEDFDALKQVPWTTQLEDAGDPKISVATNTGLDILLNKLVPSKGGLGESLSIEQFLSGVCRDKDTKVLFTGHSLGATLAGTLGLWFKERQGLADEWDPKNRAEVFVATFAGATAGNGDFSKLSNRLLGDHFLRVYNTLDVVPHAWHYIDLLAIKDLYAPSIKLNEVLKLAIDGVTAFTKDKDYQQTGQDFPITWEIQPPQEGENQSFISQAGIQHSHSYPSFFNVPELVDKEIIKAE